MADYTDDAGEMDGVALHAAPLHLHDLLAGTEPVETWPTRVFRTLANGSEETVSYRYPGAIQAVRFDKNREVTLEFADGKTVSAHLAKDFHLINGLDDGKK